MICTLKTMAPIRVLSTHTLQRFGMGPATRPLIFLLLLAQRPSVVIPGVSAGNARIYLS
jgi:hypothetical protein